MKRKLLFSSVILFGLILTACGASTPAASSSTLAPQAATVIGTAVVPITGSNTATPGAPSVVNLSQTSSLGSFLVDGKGMTLYIYTMDSPNTSTCYGECAAAWPPLLTDGTPTPGSGVNPSLLKTTTRSDGSTQVTYNGHPLYYFARDTVPGDTTGEGVQNVWYVITPQGNQR
jgi:predicted lipoprotein with Yx(FWY)xxD motif